MGDAQLVATTEHGGHANDIHVLFAAMPKGLAESPCVADAAMSDSIGYGCYGYEVWLSIPGLKSLIDCGPCCTLPGAYESVRRSLRQYATPDKPCRACIIHKQNGQEKGYRIWDGATWLDWRPPIA